MNPDQRFEIVVPDDPAVLVEHADPRTHPVFKRLFEAPQFGLYASEVLPFANYCLVFTNRSSQRITALTVWWKYPHPTLRGPTGIFSMTDAYYLGDNSRQVLFPGEQSLLYPKGAFPARWLALEGLMYMGGDSMKNGLRPIDMILAAPLVTAAIDAVIFEDGRVLGRDESQTVNRLKERKRAAGDFVRLVRRAVDDGLDAHATLKSLCMAQPGVKTDHYLRALRMFTTMLRSKGDPTAILPQFANLPELPEFRR